MANKEKKKKKTRWLERVQEMGWIAGKVFGERFYYKNELHKRAIRVSSSWTILDGGELDYKRIKFVLNKMTAGRLLLPQQNGIG